MTTSETLARLLAMTEPSRATSDDDLDVQEHPARRARRPAAVLVGILDAPDGGRVLLTRRSARLLHHPGQIAFPGGKIEPGDDGPRGAALREAHEEVGLDPAGVRVLEEMPSHETVTGFTVVPVLVRIEAAGDWRPEAGEVEEVFTVPLAHLMDPAAYSVQSRRWRGSERHYYTVPWGPYYIWGATARILRALAERVRS